MAQTTGSSTVAALGEVAFVYAAIAASIWLAVFAYTALRMTNAPPQTDERTAAQSAFLMNILAGAIITVSASLALLINDFTIPSPSGATTAIAAGTAAMAVVAGLAEAQRANAPRWAAMFTPTAELTALTLAATLIITSL